MSKDNDRKSEDDDLMYEEPPVTTFWQRLRWCLRSPDKEKRHTGDPEKDWGIVGGADPDPFWQRLRIFIRSEFRFRFSFKEKLNAFAFRILMWTQRRSNYMTHCRAEVKRAGLLKSDSVYDGMLGQAALELCAAFSAQGHSGMSASIMRRIVDDLTGWQPLTPLTDSPDEWRKCDFGLPGLEHNVRCSEVWRDDTTPDGFARYDDGFRFRDESDGEDAFSYGSAFSARLFRLPGLPPKPVTVIVPQRECGIEADAVIAWVRQADLDKDEADATINYMHATLARLQGGEEGDLS